MVAEMVFAPFEMVLTAPPSNPMLLEDPSAALFSRLDKSSRCPVQQIGSGEHMLAVYGDNFIQKTLFKLHPVLIEEGDQTLVHLKEVNDRLRASQASISEFEHTFMEARRAYEAAQLKYAEQEEELTEVLEEQAATRAALFGVVRKEAAAKGKKSKGCAQQ
eukprot:TRINITY_DN7874_c0_g1_i1.p2 TRINITY_DN7874_c0_g1~~TRINITY_DN7874_c0_g1_i1.p2  ORF type:complete len:161 (+),score=59.87 TRINITY_DN7874_c0_g1_i1:899-1381(+)